MATIPAIRGMLLEEALLYLLRVSGYETVETAGGDRTLHDGSRGLEVCGRGGNHQIDAVADFSIGHPFSNPQRLLLEAKCFATKPVGIEIVRNAVGVLKDVGEYFVAHPGTGRIVRSRYHYQYALFSASAYTIDAEAYAFAQDIYLIPLQRSAFIRPIVEAIFAVTRETFGAANWNSVDVDMTALRRFVRLGLRREQGARMNAGIGIAVDAGLRGLFAACHAVNAAVLATLNRRFPIFLVPAGGVLQELGVGPHRIRIRFDDEGWYIDAANGRRRLFSFDLPDELFELYAEHGQLDRERALVLKQEVMSEIQAFVTVDGSVRVVTFTLDREWIESIRARMRQDRRGREQRNAE